MTKKNKMKYIIISLFIFFIFFIFFISSNVFASNYEKYGEMLKNELISSGKFDFIGETLLNDGFLNTIPADTFDVSGTDTPFYDFIWNVNNEGGALQSLISRPGNYQAINKTRYAGYDKYTQKLLELYWDIYDQFKEADGELAKCLAKQQIKSKGSWENKNNINFINYVMSNMIQQYSENAKKEWDKAECSDKGGSFKYNGKEYSCSSITYSGNTDYSNVGGGGYSLFAGNIKFGSNGGLSVIKYSGIEKSKKKLESSPTLDSITCVDKQEEKKKENKDDDDDIKIYVYEEVIGSAPENEKTNVEIIELEMSEKYSFNFNLLTGKEPNLINAIKYSTEASKAGELVLNVEGSKVNFSNQFTENLIEPLLDIILDYGKYIVYAALFFFGIRAIFSGAKGKSDFKSILPYLLIALVFFYSGRGIVDMIKETYEESIKIGGTTYDENAYNVFLSKIFGTVVYIVRILAFAGIIYAGLKYMFTSPSEKAEIKKRMLAIVIGCIFVFSSTFVVNLVVNSLSDAGLNNDIEVTDGS